MRFVANHLTRFRYGAPVHLETHAIRLRPRCDGSQRLLRFRLEIEPRPSLLAEFVDSEGNDVAQAWFSGPASELRVRTEFEVETLRKNPFEYILFGERPAQLPVDYAPAERRQLAGALERCDPTAASVSEFARTLAHRAGGGTLAFLGALTSSLHSRSEPELRVSGDPMAPGECLRASRVACRDLAVLFAECCREVGIAARFVSGYAHQPSESAATQMHAWAEVYLPGAGWRGYDPSQGLAVADSHVAVAAAHVPSGAAPTSGSFRGSVATGPIEYEIRLSAL